MTVSILARSGRPVGDPCGRAMGMIYRDRDRDRIKAADVIEMQINRAVTYALPRSTRIRIVGQATW